MTTPFSTAVLISSFVEPDPPWKTRNLSNISDSIVALVTGNLQRLLLASLLLGVDLVLVEELRVKLDVTGLVDTVDVTKGSSNTEVGGNFGESLVDIPNVLGLGIELGVVDASVVDTILFTTSDADLHLEPDTERCHTLEVLHADLDVLLLWLLGEIQHVRREKGFTVLLEVFLIGLQHAVEPREELVCTVIRVKDHGAEIIELSGAH